MLLARFRPTAFPSVWKAHSPPPAHGHGPGWYFRATTVITLVGGTIFLMWLGEQITQRGVGNGISLIIFSGIVANLPQALAQTLDLGQRGALPVRHPGAVGALGRGHRLHRVHGTRPAASDRPVSRNARSATRCSAAESSHLPLKLNTAGVIPPIFASSLLLMPLTIAGFSGGQGPEWLSWVQAWLGPGQPLYLGVYIALIVFFAFFYTSVVFNPEDTADNLKKYGGFIPGIRPGKNTAVYLDYVLTRLTVVGAAYLSVVCILPEFCAGSSRCRSISAEQAC